MGSNRQFFEMDRSRRSFVRALSLATVVVAGCVGGGETDAGGDDTPTTDATSEDDTPTDTGATPDDTPAPTDTASEDDTSPPAESSYTLSVKPVTEETLLERFGVATLEEQPSTVRNAIRKAVSDRYETDAIDGELATFLAGHEYVHVDGTYYSLETKLPQEVLKLSPVENDDMAETEIVGGRRLRESAIVAEAVAEAAEHGEAKRATFPDLLSELVAEYEYVTPDPEDDEDRDIYEWALETVDNGGPPYWVDATAVERETVFGAEVVALESLSPDAQAEIEAAREKGDVSFEDSPAVLDEPSFQYVRIDGTIYYVAVSVRN